MVKEITGNNMAEANASKVALVDFNASWCGPCKMLAPVLKSVSEEVPGVDFYGVDVDENQELAAKFGIQSVPTLVLLKEGKKVAQNLGFIPKEKLMEFISSNE